MGAAYIRCFGQCLVASATEASIGVLWQYMMGDCEPGFEFSGMAVLAMQSCGYSCLNPRNWGGKRAKASTKSKAYENRAHVAGDESPKAKATRITKSVEPKVGSAGGDGAKKAFSAKVKDQARKESNDTCVLCGTKTAREP